MTNRPPAVSSTNSPPREFDELPTQRVGWREHVALSPVDVGVVLALEKPPRELQGLSIGGGHAYLLEDWRGRRRRPAMRGARCPYKLIWRSSSSSRVCGLTSHASPSRAARLHRGVAVGRQPDGRRSLWHKGQPGVGEPNPGPLAVTAPPVSMD
jgi:hypothetical protein